MLYPQASKANLSSAVFADPPSEYRGAPFWSWNGRLDEQELLRQIAVFKEMGIGGFHIHSRTGLATPYLGDEFMALVKSAVQKAKSESMLCWLYDEDRWPSGFAGGLVTKNPQYRAKHLLLTTEPLDPNRPLGPRYDDSTASSMRTEEGTLLGTYEVLIEDGRLSKYIRRVTHESRYPTGRVWYAYLQTAADNPWFNNQAYVDTLDPEAIQEFIKVTHERYKKAVGNDFGKTIPAIFTDEPQFSHKQHLDFANQVKDLVIPFTDDFASSFQQRWGFDLLDYLPELFWDFTPGRYSKARYLYHEHVAELFARAYADQLGSWCERNNIMLTGHMMEEPTLYSQTHALGDAMRSYRSFQLPGIDMLCDWRELTTAKQAQSAAHQFGRPGVLSELYGVTNWDFDFRGHKLQGDWQAALGVTVRVHHLSWVTMAGEAKRDYPASIGYQSPWYKEYHQVEDHFARVNCALTRGTPVVKIGVIHPIESYWLLWGPTEQSGRARADMERDFQNVTNWLLFNHLDFDFIAESLISDLTTEDGALGAMRYDVIIVPRLITIRATTLEYLRKFHTFGGKVCFAGGYPELIDTEPAVVSKRFIDIAHRIGFSESALVETLEPFRTVGIEDEHGGQAPNLIYQLRQDGERRYLFVAHVYAPAKRDQTTARAIRISVEGFWKPTLMDTAAGTRRDVPATLTGDKTVIHWDAYSHDSLLLELTAVNNAEGVIRNAPLVTKASKYVDLETAYARTKTKTSPIAAAAAGREIARLHGPVPVTLDEPNVLVLDLPEYALDADDWQPAEEILRLDNGFRSRLGWVKRYASLPQPWTWPEETTEAHRARLRYRFTSDIAVKGAELALEQPERATITLDGTAVRTKVTGWFVDKAIATVALPAIGIGDHELVVEYDYRPSTQLETLYVLGNFGVEVRGCNTRIVAPVTHLHFGDWTVQGLPFYVGNLTYHLTLPGTTKPAPDASEDPVVLQIPQYRGALVGVVHAGKSVGTVVYAPYQVTVDRAQSASVDVKLFGHRGNAFGQLHNPDPEYRWWGPNAWRTDGAAWSYEYVLRPMGILAAPRVMQ